jgi:glycosyltransferase involved in cell wall biosynthesis
MRVSVIICAHNPRPDYLRRVLDALMVQTLSKELWELLLIDNASKVKLADSWDLSWHSHARHVREEELGLTPARVRGIREAQCELLVFVDDDCELDGHYLAQALQVAERHLALGAWGGQCLPCFEQEPMEWTKPYWGHLTIRRFTKERWSNVSTDDECVPWGAGLCIRSCVAKAYLQRVEADPLLNKLDRKGSQLLSCGDLDMALTACDLGFGVGIFPQLQLNHLIPKNRIQEEYLLKVYEGHAYSSLIMNVRRGQAFAGRPIDPFRRFLGQTKRRFTMPAVTRRFFEARLNGQQKALEDIIKWGLNLPGPR